MLYKALTIAREYGSGGAEIASIIANVQEDWGCVRNSTLRLDVLRKRSNMPGDGVGQLKNAG